MVPPKAHTHANTKYASTSFLSGCDARLDSCNRCEIAGWSAGLHCWTPPQQLVRLLGPAHLHAQARPRTVIRTPLKHSASQVHQACTTIRTHRDTYSSACSQEAGCGRALRMRSRIYFIINHVIVIFTIIIFIIIVIIVVVIFILNFNYYYLLLIKGPQLQQGSAPAAGCPPGSCTRSWPG